MHLLGFGITADSSESRFEFTRRTHAVLHVETDADLTQLADGFLREREKRGIPVKHRAVLTYAANCYDAADSEWTAFLHLPEGSDWLRAVQARRSA